MLNKFRNSKNVLHYVFGVGSLNETGEILAKKRPDKDGYAIYFIDGYFKDKELIKRLPADEHDEMIFVDTAEEPKTSFINELFFNLRTIRKDKPYALVGIGGGATLDVAKAISNLLTNGGKAEDYQGWDLVRKPGIYKVGIPTLSGTGAESSRTCVMTNPENGLKLGMNSDFSIYDQLILDPDLTKTVPENQFFYTGMDTYIHCIESLNGRHRNAVGDAFSDQALKLSREVFFSEDMKSHANREKIMIASYLGGCAIANSYVGVVHPFSAGLSVVLGIHHGIGNCIALAALREFYPKEVEEFLVLIYRHKVNIPKGICADLTAEQYERLYKSTIMHEKPLSNALGDSFRSILTEEKVIEIFRRM